MEKIRWYWLLIIGLALILIAGFLLILLRGDEDTWIQDETGVWISHGNPASMPDYVYEQQIIIECAINLYMNTEEELNSQCLGRCLDYSVDIVNVPRNSEDDKPENQCADYKNQITHHFIELNKNGEIVKIA